MIYVFLADGFEEIEALTTVDLCRRANLELKTVSIGADQNVMGSHMIPVKADIMLSDVDWDATDITVLPGGKLGTDNLNACEELMGRVSERISAGKPVAAICAAPALLLGDRGLVKGKKACCYPGMEDHLEGADVTYDTVAMDGTVITSRGLGTSVDFALAIITLLKDAATADDIAKKVVYKR